jgi:cytochrome P450
LYLLKETFRFHAVSPVLFREAGSDDCIPLFKPVVSTQGEEITEVPVPKGTRVTISVAAYNRTKEVFGQDAHKFNPDRWLNRDQKIGHGVPGLNLFANL